MLEMYANLHTHTTHSDGVFTPEEIVKIAKSEGYKAIAATDHDTVTAYPEMKAICEREGLETIFGCEFYALHDKYLDYFYDYHLVGYHFDPNHSDMKEYLYKRSYDMTSRTEELFELAMKEDKLPKGITWQEICDYNKGISWLCNDHVFRAMEAKGLVTEKEWEYYFKTCFAASFAHSIGQKCRYPIMQIPDLIAMIHDAGGIAVVAHPAESVQILTIPELVGFGLDGMEVWHNSVVKGGYTRKALEYALEYGLYVSGGEDHSGLCGGQYKYIEDYKNNRYYAEDLSLGTRKEFYEEIRDMKLDPKREEYIKSYIDMYPVSALPNF